MHIKIQIIAYKIILICRFLFLLWYIFFLIWNSLTIPLDVGIYKHQFFILLLQFAV